MGRKEEEEEKEEEEVEEEEEEERKGGNLGWKLKRGGGDKLVEGGRGEGKRKRKKICWNLHACTNSVVMVVLWVGWRMGGRGDPISAHTVTLQ